MVACSGNCNQGRTRCPHLEACTNNFKEKFLDYLIEFVIFVCCLFAIVWSLNV